MKVVVIVLATAAWLPLAAADRPEPKSQPKRAESVAKPLEIPAGAVETEAGTFRHTDPQGKKWVYRKTPFGVVRLEDRGAAAPAVSDSGAAARQVRVKATELGESVHFERPGPFGVYKWDRKKSELSDDERGWLEKSRQDSGAKDSRQE
jgi:hypothetical protein